MWNFPVNTVFNKRVKQNTWIGIGILLMLFISNCDVNAAARKAVTLYVDPPFVQRGEHVTFTCLHEFEENKLYSVRFYRGPREFYRYSPSEIPSNKAFPITGINVDKSLSNSTQVVLRNVDFKISGNFSCEVTADAPTFSTVTSSHIMTVVDLPTARPTLWTEKLVYGVGDILRANCSSPPSKPKADLTMTLNNMVLYAGPDDTQYLDTPEGLTMTRLSLKLLLQESHFLMPFRSNNPALILRCTAEVDDLYQKFYEVNLGSTNMDFYVSPATVTSSSEIRFIAYICLIINAALCLISSIA